MKVLIRLLLLALFAVAIFIPQGTIPDWAYWSIFVLMFAVLVIYYRVEYYVSEKAIAGAVEDQIRYSCFMAKVPPMNSEDLVRGRFVITDTSFELYQKGSPARKIWSREISEVASLQTAKVIGIRHGIILNLNDGNQDSFVVSRGEKVYTQIIEVLGWQPE